MTPPPARQFLLQATAARWRLGSVPRPPWLRLSRPRWPRPRPWRRLGAGEGSACVMTTPPSRWTAALMMPARMPREALGRPGQRRCWARRRRRGGSPPCARWRTQTTRKAPAHRGARCGSARRRTRACRRARSRTLTRTRRRPRRRCRRCVGLVRARAPALSLVRVAPMHARRRRQRQPRAYRGRGRAAVVCAAAAGAAARGAG